MDLKKVTSTPEHYGASSSKYSLRNSAAARKNLRYGDESGRKIGKRKRMTNIINNIEKEIEEQLETETEKNDFITTNVNAIVKEVIRDEDIKEMVRQTLHPRDSSKCYEPKLTRAKVRELLKLRPDLSLPILWPLPAKNTNFVSECLSLINEDFSENSSEDEEYKPDDDDKSEYADSLLPCERAESERGLNDSLELFDQPRSVDTVHEAEIEENIGQRTRSKLPLTETPLEVIEQRFVPPDITSDMYDTECDNEDWRDFIQGIVQPIGPEHADDPEDDPEYTIQADDEKVDREELRKDKAVEVPIDEVEELITEYLRENEAFLNMKTIETSVSRQPDPIACEDSESIACDDSEPEQPEEDDDTPPVVTKPKIPTSECPVLTDSQRLLLEQQIRQHVQLTLTHFLQCHKHPTLFRLAEEMKINLVSMQHLAGFNRKSAFYASNLDDALKVAEEWETIRADVPKPRTLNFLKKRKKGRKMKSFDPELMKIVCKSEALLYPLMLPRIPFDSGIDRNLRRRYILPSEEWLLVCGLKQFTEHVKQTRKKTEKVSVNVMWESLKLIVHYLLPHFTPTFLYRFIKMRMSEERNNCVKYYFENDDAPVLKHYIIPVEPKPLCRQASELLHPIWECYIKTNFVIVTPLSKTVTTCPPDKKEEK